MSRFTLKNTIGTLFKVFSKSTNRDLILRGELSGVFRDKFEDYISMHTKASWSLKIENSENFVTCIRTR